MNRATSCCSTACVAVWIALGAGCADRSIPPRDASEGRAEEQAADPGAPATAQGRTDGAEGTGAERDPHRTRRTLGWISLAVGAEAAIIAGVTSVMLLHEKSVLNDNCDARKVCSPDGIDAAGSISGLVPLNTTAWIVAAAGVGIGTVLVVTSRSDSGKSTALTVSPTPAGAAFGVRSQF